MQEVECTLRNEHSTYVASQNGLAANRILCEESITFFLPINHPHKGRKECWDKLFQAELVSRVNFYIVSSWELKQQTNYYTRGKHWKNIRKWRYSWESWYRRMIIKRFNKRTWMQFVYYYYSYFFQSSLCVNLL